MAAFVESERAAAAMASRLPLVHRTAYPAQPGDWRNILSERRFRVSTEITQAERDCGFNSAAYFFLGCAAFDKGSVAFLVETSALRNSTATFTPFDTGAVEKEYIAPEPRPMKWLHPERLRCLQEHMGTVQDLAQFAGPYVAAHLNDPLDYVSRPQRAEPDYSAFHGLVSPTGDRRAWTIEVQAHDDVTIEVDSLRRVLLGRKHLIDDIPDAFLAHVEVVGTDEETDLDFQHSVSARILLSMAGGET